MRTCKVKLRQVELGQYRVESFTFCPVSSDLNVGDIIGRDRLKRWVDWPVLCAPSADGTVVPARLRRKEDTYLVCVEIVGEVKQEQAEVGEEQEQTLRVDMMESQPF